MQAPIKVIKIQLDDTRPQVSVAWLVESTDPARRGEGWIVQSGTPIDLLEAVKAFYEKAGYMPGVAVVPLVSRRLPLHHPPPPAVKHDFDAARRNFARDDV